MVVMTIVWNFYLEIKENMYTVYRMIFPNGKSYIGMTKDFQARQKSHKQRMKDNKCKYLLYNALRKYGFENIEWNVLSLHTYVKCAEQSERYYIQYYSNNYNQTSGGLVHEMTPEIKDKIGKANAGRITSKETREKQSRILKEIYSKFPKNIKNESKRKFSQQACDNMKKSRQAKREKRILLLVDSYQDGMTLKELSDITNIPIRTICDYTDEWRDRYEQRKELKL